MSRSSVTSKRSRRRSKDSSRGGASAQSADLDERPPPQIDTVPPVDNKEENCEPSVVESSSGISNSGTPQPSEPHAQEDTINDLPQGALTTDEKKNVAQEDQPTLSDIMKVVEQMFHVLRHSTIASKTDKDKHSLFLAAYKKVAEEHDDEFLEKYNGDMDVMLIFSGLFSAVSSAFIVAMESNLSPDPDDTTHALLAQLVQIGLGNFTAVGSTPATQASTWSPPIASIRIQSIAYASLSFSLLAAFGAVLGKQWLGYYKSQRYGRGSEEERAKRRQEKSDGIVTWYFDAVVQSFPILLQFSLLLFGIALSANMWYEQHTVAWVIIATTVFGFLFYSLTVMAALISPACPFQTPTSTILRMLRVDRVLRPMFKSTLQFLKMLVTSVYRFFQMLVTLVYRVLLLMGSCVQYGLPIDRLYRSRVMRRIQSKLADFVFAAYSFARRCLQPLFGAFQCLPPWRHSSTRVVDPEAQAPDQNRNDLATNQDTLNIELSDILTNSSRIHRIKWLLEISTDPEIVSTAASIVPDVGWPLQLDVLNLLRSLYNVYTTYLDIEERIIPSLEEKASACTKALCHLYCHRILQGHHDDGFFGVGDSDYDVFRKMLESKGINDNTTTKLFVAKYAPRVSSPKFCACPDPVPFLEWLLRALPLHCNEVDEDVEALVATVISKLLSSPSSPSLQIMANCTLLACVLVGVDFDKKDIVRVDKSSALPQLTECLFQGVIRGLNSWSSIDDYVRQARIDISCRVLNCVPPYPSLHMWDTGIYWKIFSQARRSQHNDRSALRKVRRFGFTVKPPWNPAVPSQVWHHQIWWQDYTFSPEDFDLLFDYFGDVCSSDQNTAGNILVLLSSMEVSCSPAKQRPFIEALITCMGSSMPPRLRHAALRAICSSREVLASIDVVDDADMLLTNLSRAILTAVCPQPDVTPTNDSPDCFFYDERDLCYLKLIFSLARNSYWRPHLHCQMDRAIRMIKECCNSGSSHTFYLIGFFLRMRSEEVSATSLSSIDRGQLEDICLKAWYWAFSITDDARCVEFLPVLVEETNKYEVYEYHRKQLAENVERLMRNLERDRNQGDVEKLRSMIKGAL